VPFGIPTGPYVRKHCLPHYRFVQKIRPAGKGNPGVYIRTTTLVPVNLPGRKGLQRVEVLSPADAVKSLATQGFLGYEDDGRVGGGAEPVAADFEETAGGLVWTRLMTANKMFHDYLEPIIAAGNDSREVIKQAFDAQDTDPEWQPYPQWIQVPDSAAGVDTDALFSNFMADLATFYDGPALTMARRIGAVEVDNREAVPQKVLALPARFVYNRLCSYLGFDLDKEFFPCRLSAGDFAHNEKWLAHVLSTRFGVNAWQKPGFLVLPPRAELLDTLARRLDTQGAKAVLAAHRAFTASLAEARDKTLQAGEPLPSAFVRVLENLEKTPAFRAGSKRPVDSDDDE